MAMRLVVEAVIFNAIMGIKSDAVGADGLSIKFIRIVFPHFLTVLTHLFNFVITPSSFPTAWKTAIVLPSLNQELRLVWRILILLAFFQCFRRGLRGFCVISSLIYWVFLSHFQSGFRRFHSTATALTSIMDDIHLSVERSGFSVEVLLDFSKEFDYMAHGLLLRFCCAVQYGLQVIW
jgi:hypothetical protein